MEKKVKKKYVRNELGCKIYKCCASCAHCKLSTLSDHICMVGHGQVPRSFSCELWEMNKAMTKAGTGAGYVKDKEYLNLVKDFYHHFREMVDDGKLDKMPELKEIHAKAKQAYKVASGGRSIYINI